MNPVVSRAVPHQLETLTGIMGQRALDRWRVVGRPVVLDVQILPAAHVLEIVHPVVADPAGL